MSAMREVALEKEIVDLEAKLAEARADILAVEDRLSTAHGIADELQAEVERLREACIRKDCDYGLEIRHLREAVREIRGRALASRGRDVGKVEARARLDCIAEAARAALRGGGERCLCDDDSPNHCAKCTRELLRGGGE